MKTEKVTERRELECILTDAELMERSREMAKAAQDKAEAEGSKSASAAAYNDVIKQADAQIGVLARKVSTGREFRGVECEWTFDWAKELKTLTRMDIGEEIDIRTITDYERQQRLDLEKEREEAEEEAEEEESVDSEEPEQELEAGD